MPLWALVLVPLSVYANIATTTHTPVVAPVIAKTSATEVVLLSAHATANPKAARGGGDLIVAEGTLVPGGIVGEDLQDESFQSGEISLYVVREGDTLSQIAEMFDVNSNTILWANDITKASHIQPGDTLVILPITGVRHVVKSGDTLAAIAKKYDGDVDEILSYNQLATASDITVGDTVVVPGGNMQQAAPVRKAAPTSVTGSASVAVGFTHPAPGATRTQGIHGYNAVDLAGTHGMNIRAAASGEVIVSKSSGWNGGYGNYIVVRHGNGSQTLYAHLSYNSVGVGAFVGAGEVIGAMGTTAGLRGHISTLKSAVQGIHFKRANLLDYEKRPYLEHSSQSGLFSCPPRISS